MTELTDPALIALREQVLVLQPIPVRVGPV
jgi:hypothetical protein